MQATSRLLLAAPIVCSAFWALSPARGEEAAPRKEVCAPEGVTIPFAAVTPRNWNTWIASLDLKDTSCRGVSIVELRSRARKNSQGELEITFKVVTFTEPGHDKEATVTIEVLAAERVLKSTTLPPIDAEEKKNGRGSGYLFLPVDMIPGDAEPRLRITLEAVDD